MKLLLLLLSFFTGSLLALNRTTIRHHFTNDQKALARAVLMGEITPAAASKIDLTDKDVAAKAASKVKVVGDTAKAAVKPADEAKANGGGVTVFQMLQQVSKNLAPQRTASVSSTSSAAASVVGTGSQTSSSGGDNDSPRVVTVKRTESPAIAIGSPAQKLIVGSVAAGSVLAGRRSLADALTPDDDEQTFAAGKSASKKLSIQTGTIPTALTDLDGNSDSEAGRDADDDESSGE